MLSKFKKLEEQIYNSDVNNEAEMTFCNPSETEKESENCEVITISENHLEEHVEEVHLEINVKESSLENKSNNENQIKKCAIVYKCELCEFETVHHPGLKSHMTKMHGRTIEHQCEQCSEKFETRKKLKNHIYCIHSGKYKTFAELCAEANP